MAGACRSAENHAILRGAGDGESVVPGTDRTSSLAGRGHTAGIIDVRSDIRDFLALGRARIALAQAGLSAQVGR
jgi:hypothetical protein